MDLSERKLRILQAIVDDYIVSGMPIGSRTISRMWGGRYSPATIRNEMSDLEEMGYLSSRTSAGRVPSDGGVSAACRPLFAGAKAVMRKRKDPRLPSISLGHMDDVITTTARVLSETPPIMWRWCCQSHPEHPLPADPPDPRDAGPRAGSVCDGWRPCQNVLIPIPEEMDERYLETVSNALTEQMRGRPSKTCRRW